MLEANLHTDNSFVTLTYDDEHLPPGGTLDPTHVQLFIKRFRKALEPVKIRYYLVGEYGDQSDRPHYHVALFGYPSCLKGITNPNRGGYCCSVCDGVRAVWGHGNIYSGGLSHASASYIAGYVTKKLTDPNDPELGGRYPEFSRQSTRPGIGADFMDEVASVLLTRNLDALMDVPVALRHGAKQYPLGRYLRRRLRSRMGKEENAPKETLAKMDQEMQILFEEAKAVSPLLVTTRVKNAIIDQNKSLALKLRSKNKRGKGHL